MMNSSKTIYIGRVLGIPIGLDFSWFFILIFLSWLLAGGYFPTAFKNWPVWQYWFAGIVSSLLLFFSVLLHELGHSVVAMFFKIPVRRIRLMVFGGIAEFDHEPESAHSEFWIALGGPVINVLLAAFLYYFWKILPDFEMTAAIVKYLMYMNMILAAFNLIPGFPLDGGRIFRAIIWAITHNWRKATVIAGTLGRAIAFLIIFWGALMVFNHNLADGLWMIFIGWFLDSAAVAQIQQSNIRTWLEGHTAQEAMNPNFAVIPSDTSLQTMMEYHIIGEGRRCILVKDKDRFAGLLTLHHLKEVPQDKWTQMMAKDIMIPLDEMKHVHAGSDLWEAFIEMQHDGVNQLPVLEKGKVIGLLSRDTLFSFLNTLHKGE